MDNFRRVLSKDGFVMEFVDLGLPSGTWWAKCNIGATSPEQVGLYYSRGNIEGHTAGYDFSSANFSGTPGSSINGKTAIPVDPAYDVARYEYGENYLIPTRDDCDELELYCTYSFSNGMHTFTSTINGNSISFPLSGYYVETTKTLPNSCIIWISDPTPDSGSKGRSATIRNNSDAILAGTYRTNSYGCSIRAVFKSGQYNLDLITPAYIKLYYQYSDNTLILPALPSNNINVSRTYSAGGYVDGSIYIGNVTASPNPRFNYKYYVEVYNKFGTILWDTFLSDESYCNVQFKTNAPFNSITFFIEDAGNYYSNIEAEGLYGLLLAGISHTYDETSLYPYNNTRLSDLFNSEQLLSFETYVKQYNSDFSVEDYSDIPVFVSIWAMCYHVLPTIDLPILNSGNSCTYNVMQTNYRISGTINDSTHNVTMNLTLT